MLTRIMKHDWKDLRAGGTIRMAVCLIVLLAGYAAVSGALYRSDLQKLHGAVARKEKDELAAMRREAEAWAALPPESRPERLPDGVKATSRNRLFRYAVLPPGPLGALAVGQSDIFPSYFKVDAGISSRFLTRSELENPLNLQSGRFDFAFFVVFLFPLFLLALTFDLLSREREQGTLALVLAQPVKLRTLLAAKAAVRWAVVTVPVLLTAAMTALLTAGGERPGEILARFLVLGAVVAVYGLFWCGLAVLVNARGMGSAANALVLAGLWLALTVVVPALSSIAVTSLYPPPSRMELIIALNDARNEANKRGEALLDTYAEHPELVPVRGDGRPTDPMVRSIVTAEEAERAARPVLERHRKQLERQQALARKLVYLSPASLVQSALNALAGSSTARFEAFVGQVTAFHEEWKKFFYARFMRGALLTPEDYDQFPRFEYQPEPLRPVLTRALGSLAVLAGLTGLLFWSGMRRLSRRETIF